MTSRSSARRTPTTGTRRSPRPRWNSSSRTTDNDVQAVLSENDSMAGGVVAALEAQGLAGQVPVGGQDGDLPALNRVALGTQTVSVWKDSRILGEAAGEAALELCADPDLAVCYGDRSVHVAGRQRVDVDILRSSGDHPGQPQPRPRGGGDRPSDAVPGRRARYGPGVRRPGRFGPGGFGPSGFGAGGHRGGGHAPATTGG